ncbi:MAG: hypothetical protein U1E67_21670 [Hyphomicrobiales bacterium]
MKAVLLRFGARLALILLIVLGSHTALMAQDNAAATQKPRGINPVIAEKLVKYAIIAVDQGNATGNYSVLRELGTPRFQATTSSARLSDAFAGLRKMKLDMSALMMLKPTFTKPPVVENGQLKVVGFFPTTPIRINFAISYAQQNGQARIATLNITPAKVTAAAGDAAASGNAAATKSDQQ